MKTSDKPKRHAGVLGKALLVVVVGLNFAACSSQKVKKDLDEKMNQEVFVNSREDLNKEANYLIDKDTSITAEQKQKLQNLKLNIKRQLDQVNDTSLRLRSILVKDLLATSYNEDEVELIKDRLSKLEHSRLKIQFSALEEANSILGHKSANFSGVVHDLFEPNSQNH